MNEQKKPARVFDRNEIMVRIENAMTEGKSVASVLREKDTPDQSTFYRWLNKDENLQERMSRAFSIRGHFHSEQALKAAKGKRDKNSKDDIARDRLKFDAHRWAAGRMNPKRYGDKVDVTSDGNKLTGISFAVIDKREDAKPDAES